MPDQGRERDRDKIWMSTGTSPRGNHRERDTLLRERTEASRLEIIA